MTSLGLEKFKMDTKQYVKYVNIGLGHYTAVIPKGKGGIICADILGQK